MKIYLQSDVDADKILRNRGLGSNGLVAKFMASEVKRLCEPYVPMQQGVMKNSAQISGNGKYLIYPGPYAHYQHTGEVYGPNIPLGDGRFISKAPKHPTGKRIQYHGGPMRGDHWEKRMMADHKDDLERSTENYIRSLGK